MKYLQKKKRCPGKENWEFKIAILREHPELKITTLWEKD